MEICAEYRLQNEDAKVSFSGDMRDWSWFKTLSSQIKRLIR